MTREQFARWEAGISSVIALVLLMTPCTVLLRPDVGEFVGRQWPGFWAAIGLGLAIGALRFGSLGTQIVGACAMFINLQVYVGVAYGLFKYW